MQDVSSEIEHAVKDGDVMPFAQLIAQRGLDL
jgi:hypothetical protein